MRKYLTALILVGSVFMGGCATQPENIKPLPVLVPQIQYVVRVPPASLMTLPPQVPNIDVDTAKQSDVARWIAANEKRTDQLENQLIGVAKYLQDQQSSLDVQAQKQNQAPVK